VRYFPLESLPAFKTNPSSNRDGFRELIPGARSHPSRTDFKLPGVLSEEEIKWVRLAPQPVRPLGYYRLRDAVLCGEGYVLKGNKVCFAPSVIPAYWRELLEAQPQLVPSPRDLALRELPSRSMLFVSRDYNNYMHWWMEIVPRIYPIWLHEPGLLKELAVVIPADLSSWCRESLHTLFGIEGPALVTYDLTREVVRCPTAVLPAMVHTDYNFHPAAADFYRHVVEKCRRQPAATGTSGILFLTRRHSGRTRVLANAPEAEALAASLGFEVVAPETLPWQEQVSLFSRARIVAGEHGAAMKNLLFAPGDAVGIVINHVNPTQATLAALKRQRCIIVGTEGSTPSYDRPFSVDLKRLKSCLEHGLRLAGC
jgi:hypothetical protein